MPPCPNAEPESVHRPVVDPLFAPHRVGLPDAPACPPGADATYLLVYNDPEGPAQDQPTGWVLDAWDGDAVRWRATLAAHGAGALAGPRQAKAVVVRALTDRGVIVDDWETDTDPRRPAYRARLRRDLAGPRPAEQRADDDGRRQFPGPRR
jgi:hypothetical protein